MAKHLHSGVECEHLTKKACEAARKEAMGRCSELLQSDKSGSTTCSNWAVERVNDRGVCGQHYGSMLDRQTKAEREAARRARIESAIQGYLDREPERQAATIAWWEANATPHMRTVQVLDMIRVSMRDVA